jgi:hypothetical protein
VQIHSILQICYAPLGVTDELRAKVDNASPYQRLRMDATA